MKIVTFNVNSLKARAEHVADFLDRVSPTVLCMQELKLEDDKVPREIFAERGYFLETHGQKTYNGVAIASKLPMSQVHRGLPDGDEGESRLIAATIDGVRITNLYCPQGRKVGHEKFDYKLRFYDALQTWLEATQDPASPVVITGDLNIAPQDDDVYDVVKMEGVCSFTQVEKDKFQRLLDWGLTDASKPYLAPRSFTFWDYRMNCYARDAGYRIDHFLVSQPVLDRVQGSRIHRLERGKEKASDHAPVELTLG